MIFLSYSIKEKKKDPADRTRDCETRFSAALVTP